MATINIQMIRIETYYDLCYTTRYFCPKISLKSFAILIWKSKILVFYACLFLNLANIAQI